MYLSALIILTILLFGLEMLYFRLADHFNIIDKPNHRSSHTKITIRGGGIIFSMAMMLCPLFFGLQYPLFLVGLAAVAFISFVDDINPVSSKVRIAIHLLGAVLLIIQLNLLHAPIYVNLIALFLIIATINAVNFMDGINGITGIYSLVTLATLYYLNYNLGFTNGNYLAAALISVVVFDFFNFRQVARCFAGDVGSVAIAFIILFFLGQLIVKTQSWAYIFFIALYALDTATTMVFRFIRKEKITEAHRSHFYQFMANEKRIPHLFVAFLYGITQLIINIAIIKTAITSVTGLILLFVILTAAFLLLRFVTEGRKHLLAR